MFPSQIAVVDFEACGFGPGTWPIEAGWIRAGDVAPRSMIIKPHPKFNLDLWNADSQLIHKHTLAEIQNNGIDAGEVLAVMQRELAGRLVISDAPSYDQAWLNTMALACDQEAPFQISDLIAAYDMIHDATGAMLNDMLNAYRGAMTKSGPVPHRAGADAKQIMDGLRATFSAVEKAAPRYQTDRPQKFI